MIFFDKNVLFLNKFLRGYLANQNIRQKVKCLDPRTPKGEFAQVSLVWTSRPLPSNPELLYENEVKCSAFDMEMIFHSHVD